MAIEPNDSSSTIQNPKTDTETLTVTHPSAIAENTRQLLVNNLKAFYQKSGKLQPEQLDAIYTQDVEFRDPLHTIFGILALKSYMKNLYTSSPDIRFEYTDEQSGDNWAAITWLMHFRHPCAALPRSASPTGSSTTKTFTISAPCCTSTCQCLVASFVSSIDVSATDTAQQRQDREIVKE